ncbi:hypothetical protein niasHS_006254 [Heterodera schachtii]|uniref:Uncharacterized protein n=1 Tax=Heterodera schachtii TaxID=97005 RepID=A0ABD2JST6_HETSC
MRHPLISFSKRLRFIDPNELAGKNNSVRATVLLAIQQGQKQKQQQQNKRVIKYLHPYYQRSLHDCFVKLPLKQTSANGVVGHFWTVVTRGPDEKPLGPTRRRTRGSGKAKKGTMALNGSQNGGTAANTPSGIKHGTIPTVASKKFY